MEIKIKEAINALSPIYQTKMASAVSPIFTEMNEMGSFEHSSMDGLDTILLKPIEKLGGYKMSRLTSVQPFRARCRKQLM